MSPYTSFFERRQTVPILLQSLLVTFEGQTELVTEDTGYSAFRLCSISKELVDGEPVEMNNEDHEDSVDSCSWNIVFNLTIPGWLPETANFGDHAGGTRYALHASATIQALGALGSCFSAFCTPFRVHSRIIKAPRADIHVHRFSNPLSTFATPASLWPLAHYAISPEFQYLIKEGPFPSEVLSKLRVQISLPERIGTEEESIPLVIRLRTSGLPESECKRVRISSFDVDIEQCERYRYVLLRFTTYDTPVPYAIVEQCRRHLSPLNFPFPLAPNSHRIYHY